MDSLTSTIGIANDYVLVEIRSFHRFISNIVYSSGDPAIQHEMVRGSCYQTKGSSPDSHMSFLAAKLYVDSIKKPAAEVAATDVVIPSPNSARKTRRVSKSPKSPKSTVDKQPTSVTRNSP